MTTQHTTPPSTPAPMYVDMLSLDSEQGMGESPVSAEVWVACVVVLLSCCRVLSCVVVLCCCVVVCCVGVDGLIPVAWAETVSADEEQTDKHFLITLTLRSGLRWVEDGGVRRWRGCGGGGGAEVEG